ncbi:MAG: hypothetical protein E7262_01200 [Lachnospiraceae bacterium]|nr:hypothetical protein [Lachnospiraceae bacterium]
MKEKMTNNLSLKLLSLFIALVVWVVIVNVEDPTVSKTIKGINVEVINENAISEAGKCYVLDSDGQVDIRVRAPKSVADMLKASDFTAIADLSKYSITNTVPVEVSFSSNRNFSKDPEIVYGDKNNINIILDDYVTREFDVSLGIKGNTTDGYYVSKEQIVMDTSKVKVSGPETTLNNISRVAITVDVSDVKEETSMIAKIRVLDNNAKEIVSDRVTYNRDSINVTIKPLIKKEIPIKIVTEGKPRKEYSVNNSKCNINSIIIVGDKESVDSMKVIELKVDITDKKKALKKEFDLSQYISSNVIMISKETNAIVEIDFKKMIKREISFKANDIEFRNIKTGFLNKFDSDRILTVQLKGLEQYIENISIEELKPYIDLKSLKTGKHKMKVMFENTNNITVTKNAYLEIDIEDSKKVEEEPTVPEQIESTEIEPTATATSLPEEENIEQ